jgi:hypothetical protein
VKGRAKRNVHGIRGTHNRLLANDVVGEREQRSAPRERGTAASPPPSLVRSLSAAGHACLQDRVSPEPPLVRMLSAVGNARLQDLWHGKVRHTDTHTHAHTRTHAHTLTQTHTNTHTHTHTHTHTKTEIRLGSDFWSVEAAALTADRSHRTDYRSPLTLE